MIACEPATVLPWDDAVVQRLREGHWKLGFDPQYLASLPAFNGGVPRKPYFTFDNAVHRIGWMVAFLDRDCILPQPLQPSLGDSSLDTRIEDRSLPTLIDHEIDPFVWCERLFPFAALYTKGKAPRSLRLYSCDWNPDDSLCFDRTTTPQSVVYCNADRHVEEYVRYDLLCDERPDDPDTEVRYEDFVRPVARSFAEFCAMLRNKP
jgi:hypothetical protein